MLRRITPTHRIATVAASRAASTADVDPAFVKAEGIKTRQEYPLDKCRDIVGKRKVAVLGYGPQGRGQALNLRDNGFDVCVGVRKGGSFENALKDGWVEGKNLVGVEEATASSDIVQYLLSDASQIKMWDTIKPHLSAKKVLYFSHGFALAYPERTGVVPPKDIDVVLVAPKGSGLTVRNHFVEGRGINASYAVHQDATGTAKETTLALAFGIGCGHAFETTTLKEVTSDLTGERCVLMGMIQGAFAAQYKVLREAGHSPAEAYNETVEEALESLYPLVSQKGMDWMFANCSTTAQRGALDWAPKFEAAIRPVIQNCYDEVKNGNEAQRSIDTNSQPDYREKLNKELQELHDSELWTVARTLRKLRPQNQK